MNAVLWIFIALSFGFMLFVSLQDHVPDELSFLKGGDEKVFYTINMPSADGEYTIGNWTVYKQGTSYELKKNVTATESSKDVPAMPQIGILCHQGSWDFRIDTKFATTGVKKTKISFNESLGFNFERGVGTTVFPVDPRKVVEKFYKSNNLDNKMIVKISYVDFGEKSFFLENTTEMSSIMHALRSICPIEKIE